MHNWDSPTEEYTKAGAKVRIKEVCTQTGPRKILEQQRGRTQEESGKTRKGSPWASHKLPSQQLQHQRQQDF